MQKKIILMHLDINELKIRPLLPLMFILMLMGGAYCLFYFYPWSWQTLKLIQGNITNFQNEHPFWTPFLFMSFYILCAVLSFPGIFILSLLAGFLFSQPYSTIYVTIASTMGASLLFLAARTAFGELLFRKAGPKLRKLKNGFLENAASYLLFLRLFPLFPYWLVNIAGAFFAVPFRTFAWTTFVGMIPSVYVYAQAGQGFALMLNHPEPKAAALFNPSLIVALIVLSILSLVPMLFKKPSQK